ncbi:hypothetical protein DZK27_13980 [Rhodobacteraceae bacterium 63075]|nr:hypothetical protein DZK27_13980 [Rhodobacteraceae bacterium 63075]
MTLPRFALAIAGLALFASCQMGDEKSSEPSRPATDACGATELGYIIGLRASEIDFSEQADTVRVIKPNSAVTLDHRPERLNVHVSDAGIITKLTCG